MRPAFEKNVANPTVATGTLPTATAGGYADFPVALRAFWTVIQREL